MIFQVKMERKEKLKIFEHAFPIQMEDSSLISLALKERPLFQMMMMMIEQNMAFMNMWIFKVKMKRQRWKSRQKMKYKYLYL